VAIPAGSHGLTRHLGRLLGSDRGFSIIVAMDQGVGGVNKGFEDPVATVANVIAANPDGVLLTAGLARRSASLFAHRGAPGLVMAMDQAIHRDPHGAGPAVAHAPGFSVEEAMRLGADAVKTMLIMGGDSRADQLQNMAYLAKAGEQCRHWELPLMIEPYLWGVEIPSDPRGRAEVAADAARIAVELGADLIKVEYSGDFDIFAELVRTSPVPVVVLGGPKRSTQREVVANVIAAMNAGAAGITMGRNIWQQPDIERMISALSVAMSTRDLDAAMAVLEPAPAATSV
jgi:fructose-bisphosphate aldolase, class I